MLARVVGYTVRVDVADPPAPVASSSTYPDGVPVQLESRNV